MIILGTNSIKDTGFDVANSLRFNSASSDYLNRTIGSSTPSTTWTLSCWLKRSKLGVAQTFLSAAASSAGNNNNLNIKFKADDSLEYTIINSGSYNGRRISNRLFRDTSAWYNLIFVWDTSNGTAGDRMKVYVNGLQESSFTTTSNPSLNSTANIAGNIFTVGRPAYTSDASLDSYIAEVVLLDGTAVSDATSFGEFDEDSGIWKPIDVSGLTFGTNGFYLDFEDSSALGNDAAGSNNFTVNNLTAIDQSISTPTNIFATMNPLDVPASNQPTFSEGNLKVTSPSAAGTANFGGASTFAVSSGKWYVEAKATVGAGGYSRNRIGITGNESTARLNASLGANSYEYFYDSEAGNSNAGSYGDSYTTGDIIGIALNLDDNELKFYKNGTVQDSGTAISITASSSTSIGGYKITQGDSSGVSGATSTFEFNFGSPPYSESGGETDGNGYGNFAHAVPGGYYSLNTKNLAEYG